MANIFLRYNRLKRMVKVRRGEGEAMSSVQAVGVAEAGWPPLVPPQARAESVQVRILGYACYFS